MGSTPEVVSVHISKVCLRLRVVTVLRGYYLICQFWRKKKLKTEN